MGAARRGGGLAAARGCEALLAWSHYWRSTTSSRGNRGSVLTGLASPRACFGDCFPQRPSEQRRIVRSASSVYPFIQIRTEQPSPLPNKLWSFVPACSARSLIVAVSMALYPLLRPLPSGRLTPRMFVSSDGEQLSQWPRTSQLALGASGRGLPRRRRSHPCSCIRRDCG